MDKEEFYQLLKSRVSIRKYKPDPIDSELITKILQAGMEAPSGKNRQNWRFVVVQGKKRDEYLKYSERSWQAIKDVLQKRLKPSLYEFTERFFYTLGGAPVIIFAFSYNSPEEKHLTSVGSVYMAIENICLAAMVEGLGTCTMGAPLEIKEDILKFLDVSSWDEHENLEFLCAIVLGKPDHQPPKPPRQYEGRIRWL